MSDQCHHRAPHCKHHHHHDHAEGHGDFGDLASSLSRLEAPERAEWQRPDELVAALRLAGSETVVDLGAGTGYMTFPLARALPRGKVVAIEPQPELARHLRERAEREGAGNVEVLAGDARESLLPAGVELLFLCDVLHHVDAPTTWLAKLVAQLSPGSRVALVEHKEGGAHEGPPDSMRLSASRLEELLAQAGLAVEQVQEELLPRQRLVLGRKR